MRVWCRYCLDLEYIDEPTWRHWRDEYQEIAKMLNGLCSKLLGVEFHMAEVGSDPCYLTSELVAERSVSR